MSDIQAYIVLTGYHIFDNISNQVAKELETHTPVANDLHSALALGIHEDGTSANVKEWHCVSDEFAGIAQNCGEVIVYTPFGIAWGRQSNAQPLYTDPHVQKLLDSLL